MESHKSFFVPECTLLNVNMRIYMTPKTLLKLLPLFYRQPPTSTKKAYVRNGRGHEKFIKIHKMSKLQLKCHTKHALLLLLSIPHCINPQYAKALKEFTYLSLCKFYN